MTRRRRTSRNLANARELRAQMSVPEQKLWQVLRGRRLAGLKFVRQAPAEKFIVDFACRSKRVIVEVDGDSHADRAEHDRERQQALEAAGWNVVRVTNDDVLTDLEGVLCVIVRAAGLDASAWRDGEYGQLPEGSFE
jgi:very-short-patch-repair endonuclease